MSSNLESEDLSDVQLVRMEDVQPAREQRDDDQLEVKDESMETFIFEEIDYENECVVDDDDSNIGSMVSIQSEDASTPSEEVSVQSEVSIACEDLPNQAEQDPQLIEIYDQSSSELIIPDVVNTRRIIVLQNANPAPKKEVKTVPDSWPTLEILPGGVIKRSDTVDDDALTSYSAEEGNDVANESDGEAGEKMYACAKCSKKFRYLYCLVKHVRWHDKQKKDPDLSKLLPIEKEMIYIKRARLELDKSYKKQKVDVISRIAGALGQLEDISEILK
ncbi:uncharacterized protein LOC114354604 isoform X1 [Ostrinia furnacalis]|uniref:uncharacterized protein LOC114354604 isoform X1 n=1 Tax=Ostrinia furnacalis TaxID=93504 RepID=UPI00103EC68A|nr:uncharacterized protein LOC114354604 isoform X1 [Ostrinia furnacalis]